MEPFELFEQYLREMLQHLYDPVYRPPEPLWRLLGIPREQGVDAVREAILSSIEEMKPSERVPLSARAWRIYGMLRYRYIEILPQEMTAERLGITARHLRREIAEAVHALALHLWEKQEREQPLGLYAESNEWSAEPITPLQTQAAHSGTLWQAQLRREIDSLQETASGSAANLSETIDSVLRLGGHLTGRRNISLKAGPVPANLYASIHPSALRQILISVIDQFARNMERGEIEITVDPGDGTMRISISAVPVAPSVISDFVLVHEFLADLGGSVEVQSGETQTRLTLDLLSVDRCVLVVDDNPDIVHLYRRYVAGTRYYIHPINQGLQLFDAIDTYRPHVIVLDVMLPDVDGWDLLTRLHENPITRALPVVICSVMRERELALALGARHFIAKPVQRSEFINALDQVLAKA